jgi:hypothetical protein
MVFPLVAISEVTNAISIIPTTNLTIIFSILRTGFSKIITNENTQLKAIHKTIPINS